LITAIDPRTLRGLPNRKIFFAKFSLRLYGARVKTPEWHDPTRDLMLTPGRLRGLVHPLRMRLLQLLQEDGTATATSLAARIGQSSGVASYHLRVLAEHGFIVEDTERGNGRDRWWRAVHRSTSFTFRMPEDPGDAESLEDAERFIRMDADEMYQRMVSFVDTLATRRAELPELPWQLSYWPVRLTRDEARELTRKVNALVTQYRREQGDPDPRDGTERAFFQFQLLPDERPE
jgi:DNA-binding transcriptional ArsR family regulator